MSLHIMHLPMCLLVYSAAFVGGMATVVTSGPLLYDASNLAQNFLVQNWNAPRYTFSRHSRLYVEATSVLSVFFIECAVNYNTALGTSSCDRIHVRDARRRRARVVFRPVRLMNVFEVSYENKLPAIIVLV